MKMFYLMLMTSVIYWILAYNSLIHDYIVLHLSSGLVLTLIAIVSYSTASVLFSHSYSSTLVTLSDEV